MRFGGGAVGDVLCAGRTGNGTAYRYKQKPTAKRQSLIIPFRCFCLRHTHLCGNLLLIESMRTIPLTKGYVTIVDEEDYDILAKHRWFADERTMKSGEKKVYAYRSVQKDYKRLSVYMHRQILDAKRNQCVDHLNGNGLDNRRENIRLCNYSLNNHNRIKKRGTTSCYRGVCRIKGTDKWQSTISINSKLQRIGTFDTQEQAAIAYNEKAIELRGDDALLNIVPPVHTLKRVEEKKP